MLNLSENKQIYRKRHWLIEKKYFGYMWKSSWLAELGRKINSKHEYKICVLWRTTNITISHGLKENLIANEIIYLLNFHNFVVKRQQSWNRCQIIRRIIYHIQTWSQLEKNLNINLHLMIYFDTTTVSFSALREKWTKQHNLTDAFQSIVRVRLKRTRNKITLRYSNFLLSPDDTELIFWWFFLAIANVLTILFVW